MMLLVVSSSISCQRCNLHDSTDAFRSRLAAMRIAWDLEGPSCCPRPSLPWQPTKTVLSEPQLYLNNLVNATGDSSCFMSAHVLLAISIPIEWRDPIGGEMSFYGLSLNRAAADGRLFASADQMPRIHDYWTNQQMKWRAKWADLPIQHTDHALSFSAFSYQPDTLPREIYERLIKIYGTSEVAAPIHHSDAAEQSLSNTAVPVHRDNAAKSATPQAPQPLTKDDAGGKDKDGEK